MVEVEEIDLDLGLSIGGSVREKLQKPKPEEENPIEHDSRTNEFHSDLQQHAKREIQALRRQEAKKKRQKMRVRESEPEPEYETVSKREKMDNQNGLNGSAIAWTTPFHVQLVPLNNGYTLPFWVQSENGIPPFLACRSEQNGEIESVNCADRKGKSNGSSICSSSVVSDYQTSSHEDSGSTDSYSHSAHSLAEPTQLNNSLENNITTQLPEQSASSHPIRSEFSNNAELKNHTVKENLSNITQPKEEATKNSNSVPMPFTKPLCNENSSNDPLKETKPLTQTSSLSQMPYVSTTGNGPNGKTVNGFLYKYSKSEVSIVCVCHGSTFSPSEFVQHAGGTDISHPLRHITVIPSSFG